MGGGVHYSSDLTIHDVPLHVFLQNLLQSSKTEHSKSFS